MEGDTDALKQIGFNGDAKDHPAAIDILRFLGNASKKGKEIREHFSKAPYGWSQDAIDALLIVLKNAELISSNDNNLKPASINAAIFKKEIHTITAGEKIILRKLYLQAGIDCKPNEELQASTIFIAKLKSLIDTISGDTPLPEPISTKFISDLENLDGNERLRRIHDDHAELTTKCSEWIQKQSVVEKRLPAWRLLTDLEAYLPLNDEATKLTDQIDAIRTNRLIFHEPDPIEPLLAAISSMLKALLRQAKEKYKSIYDNSMAEIQANPYFARLTPEQKHSILQKYQLLVKTEIKDLDAKGLGNELKNNSLDQWDTKIAALPEQFRLALEDAMKLAVPDAQPLNIPKQTISNSQELDNYLAELKAEIQALLDKGITVILK
jgi:hypothetical protein